MANGSPRNVRARERLREAQQREAQAMASVCAAEDKLQKACAKRDALVATVTATVDEARAAVEVTHGALVAVSGIDRAARLLGVDPSTLRKSLAARSGRGSDA